MRADGRLIHARHERRSAGEQTGAARPEPTRATEEIDYCIAAPVCSASRSAFMTGMYQTTIGAHNHRSHRDDGYRLPDGVRVLSDWMRDAGYFTANVRELPEPYRFQRHGQDRLELHLRRQAVRLGRLGRSQDAPAVLRADQFPGDAPQVSCAEEGRSGEGRDSAVLSRSSRDARGLGRSISMRASELDRKIGLVLEQLEADGLADNTVVVFFGDNGQAHVRGKQFCYDSGLHMPLIIRWPKDFPAPKHYQAGHGGRPAD